MSKQRPIHHGLVALAALAIGGCSMMGSKPPPPPAPNLYPSHYKEVVADFLRTYLSNPVKVKDAFISEPTLKPVAGDSRYVSCVRYNARNSQGQYEGNDEMMAIYYGGGVNQFLPINRELCANAVYQRFPEAEVLVP